MAGMRLITVFLYDIACLYFFPQAYLEPSLKMMLEHLEETRSGLCALLTAKPVVWGLGVGLTLQKNQEKQNSSLLFKHLYKTRLKANFSRNHLIIQGAITVNLTLWLWVLLIVV